MAACSGGRRGRRRRGRTHRVEAGGGEDEVARGWGRRRTGERPGGVVVQGSRGVEAAELGRRPGTATEQEARWETTAARRRSEMCPSVGGRRRLSDIYRGPPFVPDEATTRDKRPFCPGSWLHSGQKGGPYICPLTSALLQHLGIPDLRRVAVVSHPRLLLRRRPRAPPELRHLHAPAALDDDPARPLTNKPPPPHAARPARAAPRHAVASTGAASPY